MSFNCVSSSTSSIGALSFEEGGGLINVGLGLDIVVTGDWQEVVIRELRGEVLE